jgi:hypothetical protein
VSMWNVGCIRWRRGPDTHCMYAKSRQACYSPFCGDIEL